MSGNARNTEWSAAQDQTPDPVVESALRKSTCVHGNKPLFLFLFCPLSLSNQPLGNGAAYMGTNNYFSFFLVLFLSRISTSRIDLRTWEQTIISLSLLFSFSLESAPRKWSCVHGNKQLFLSLSRVLFLSRIRPSTIDLRTCW